MQALAHADHLLRLVRGDVQPYVGGPILVQRMPATEGGLD